MSLEDFRAVNTDELLKSLDFFHVPTSSSRVNALDVELAPGKFLQCGNGAQDDQFLLLTRKFKYNSICDILLVTVITGNRDTLPKLPKSIAKKSSAGTTCPVAFLDKETIANQKSELKDTLWDVIEIPKEFLRGNGSALDHKLPKILLPLLFTQTSFSIYVDGKMSLRRAPGELIADHLTSWNAFWTAFNHHPRIGWVEEISTMKTRPHLVDPAALLRQQEEYVTAGIPLRPAGLQTTSILIRDHQHLMTKVLSCVWWSEFSKHPTLDTVSLVPALMKVGLRQPMRARTLNNIRTRGENELLKLWYDYTGNPEDFEYTYGSNRTKVVKTRPAKAPSPPKSPSPPAVRQRPKLVDGSDQVFNEIAKAAGLSASEAERRTRDSRQRRSGRGLLGIFDAFIGGGGSHREEGDGDSDFGEKISLLAGHHHVHSEVVVKSAAASPDQKRRAVVELEQFNITRGVLHVAPRCAFDAEFVKLGHRTSSRQDRRPRRQEGQPQERAGAGAAAAAAGA